MSAGGLAGGLVGAATLRGGPLDGALSVWALWTALGAAAGLALQLIRPGLRALAGWYRANESATAAVVFLAAAAPAALELGARPWASRVPGGEVVAWTGVAGVAVAASHALAWLYMRARSGGLAIPVLAGVVLATVVLPQTQLLQLPVGRWALVGGLFLAAYSVLTTSWQWVVQAGGFLLAVAGVTLLIKGGTVPIANEHLLTSTIRSPFMKEREGPSEAALGRVAEVFGRSVSGRSADLAKLVPRRLNVLWITVCTFRHDRLGKGDLTPSVDLLARRSRVFDHAWSPYPASAAASGAMFSGRYASACDGWRKKLGLAALPSQSWLPSLVKGAGYTTWAYTSLGLLARSEDFRRLFDGFDLADPAGVEEHRKGAEIVRVFTDQLATRAADAPPFFAWLFIMDAHAPYDGDPERPDPNADDLSRYDGEIRAADRAIGRALAALEARGVADRTMVIVHSDHGEAFGEHGASWHGTSVYDEQVRIPLVVHVPGLPPGRSAAPVDLTDLAPTVLEVLDIPGASGLGDSLVPALLGDEMESYACSELLVRFTPSAGQRMIVGPDLTKLIEYGGGMREVYRLTDDPGEERPLPAAQGGGLQELLAARAHVSVAGRTTKARPAVRKPLSEEVPEQVRTALTLLAGDRPNSMALRLVNDWMPDQALAAARKLVTHTWSPARTLGLNHLASHGLASDLAAVRRALDDADQTVRVAAAGALAALGGDAVVGELSRTDVPIKDAVERANVLGKLGKHDALRALIPKVPSMPVLVRERLLHGLAEAKDEDTLALAEAVARSPAAPLRERWRGVGMLISGGSPSVGRITRELTRGGLPPTEMLSLAIAMAPDDPRPVAPVFLDMIDRATPVLAWRAYRTLLRGWPVDETTALVHAWQDLAAGRSDAAQRLVAAGVDPCVPFPSPPVFDAAPKLVFDRPWDALRSVWPAVPVRVRAAEPSAVPIRLKLRASWIGDRGSPVPGPVVDVILLPGGHVVAPLPGLDEGAEVSGVIVELLSADGRTRRLE